MSEETFYCADCGRHHTGREAWDHPTLARAAFEARTAELLLEEIRNNPVEWYYISFALKKEQGGFLGGLYIKASGPTSAVKLASARGLNPGGEALVYGPLNEESMTENVPEAKRNRLLKEEEVNE
jgi:hypothetical protein